MLSQKNFYFSQKQKTNILRKFKINKKNYVCAYFRGKEFTKQTDSDKKPFGIYDDFVLVGTGFEEEVEYELK